MPRALPPPVLPQRVHIIGSGLIGTSLAMALVRAGLVVSVADASPTNEALASDLSGARIGAGDPVDLVVVATPPDVTADVVTHALATWPNAVVTDVASVKEIVRAELDAKEVPGRERYVGGHPMAGREKSGAIAARIDLFEGRPWVISRTETTDPDGVALVRGIAEAAGAVVRLLSPTEHDAAVAAVSHVPQIAASLVAARLADLSEDAVGLSGTGVRDVTRIAGSDPVLWTQILTGNAGAAAADLKALAADLGQIVDALDSLAAATTPDGQIEAPGARAVLARTIAAGNAGQARIPGKHGAAPAAYAVVTVLIPDEPGQLGRLPQDVGDAGINLEELNLEHNLGQPYGQLELSVLPAVAADLTDWLTARGWRVHD